MRNFQVIVWIVVAAAAGCGGGTDDRSSTFATEQGLKLQASPYLNLMPMVAFPDTPTICNNFIVPIAIRSASGKVASDIGVGRITVGDGIKIFWTEMSSTSETRLEDKVVTDDNALSGYPDPPILPGTYRETVLISVARGCPNAQISQGTNVVVTVELLRGGQSANVSTIARIWAAV